MLHPDFNFFYHLKFLFFLAEQSKLINRVVGEIHWARLIYWYWQILCYLCQPYR